MTVTHLGKRYPQRVARRYWQQRAEKVAVVCQLVRELPDVLDDPHEVNRLCLAISLAAGEVIMAVHEEKTMKKLEGYQDA